jgi:hypothetical protein
MRGHKTQYYEGGHRVPFFLRWPAAGLDKPRDIDEPTHSTDVLPTLLELCGLEKPADAKFDGLSLAPLIAGTAEKLPDRRLVIQYRDLRSPGAVLWKKWRLVHDRELYNIADDPGQKRNVIEKYPDIAAALRSHYARWIKEITPLQEEINTISVGVDTEPTAMLCSANWLGSYADSWQNILNHVDLKKRGIKNGYWDLRVEKSGRYEVALYGWPKQTGAAFGQGKAQDRRSGDDGRDDARRTKRCFHRIAGERRDAAASIVALRRGRQRTGRMLFRLHNETCQLPPPGHDSADGLEQLERV